MSATYDLTDRVVVITGGTGGIGSATTRRLLSRGARVAVLDVAPDTAEQVEAMSRTDAVGLIADVRDRDSLDRAVSEVLDRFGRIDVTIANAGVLPRGATLSTTPAAAVDTVFAVNINGVVNTVAATLDQIVANRGQVVLISSVFAFLNGTGTIPYAMSKAAVEQLGRGLRVELAAHGASSTTAYFSLIDTPMIKHGVDEDPAVRELLSTLPRPLLKRLPPDAAAAAIVAGIEHRSPRVTAPGRWRPFSALRGVINPALDARMSSDRRTLDAVAKLDVG